MFVYKTPLRKGVCSPRYYAVLLTDRNEVHFDKFAFSVLKTGKKYDSEKFVEQVRSKIDILAEKVRKLFWTYEIDNKTEIVFAGFGKTEDDDLYYKMFKFVESFERVYVSKTRLNFVCNRIARYFHEACIGNKATNAAVSAKLLKLYRLLLETGKCPWINFETDILVGMHSRRESVCYSICLVGLWFMAVRQYYRTCNENYGHVVKKGMTFKNYEQPGFAD